jgi:hypothetical protein
MSIAILFFFELPDCYDKYLYTQEEGDILKTV